MKKLIIAGSRNLEVSKDTLNNLFLLFNCWPTEIVSGGCVGIDRCGERYVEDNYMLPLKIFPANWEEHGKAAGPIRNAEMAKYADALLLIWDGESKGSSNMKTNMLKENKPIYEVIIKRTNSV